MKIFAGIEGGCTCSKAVLVREDGHILSSLDNGPGTNLWLEGQEECYKRINAMIQVIKQNSGLDPDSQLDGLGLCLSGCEDEEVNRTFINGFEKTFPNLTRMCAVGSDTIGSILTASPHGGIVLISGTGSNSFLLNSDGSFAKCGGWGHILGDEGAAYWIAHQAIKYVIDSEDNFQSPPYSTESVKRVILEYFEVKDTLGLLEPAYSTFKKSHFAGLCAKLAPIAMNGDDLSRHIFSLAGRDLARHVLALLPKINQKLLQGDGGLTIVCVGSVFQSWSLLKNGFLDGLNGQLAEFTMVQLVKTSAIGAAYFGATKTGHVLPMNLKENSKTLFHYKV